MTKLSVSKNALLIILSVFSILLLLTPVKILSLPILLIVATFTLPLFGRSQTVVLGALFYFLIFTCLQQLMGILFWFLGCRLTWNWSIIPFAVILIFLLGIKKLVPREAHIISNHDFISLAVSIFSVSLITMATLNGGPLTQQLIRYFTDGFDNTAHLSLTLSVYDQGGYIYGPINQTADKLVYKNLSAYPQGWHLSNSVLWHGFSDTLDIKNSVKQVLILFYLTVMLWYGLAIFFITRLLLEISEKINTTLKSRTTTLISSFALMILLQLVLLISILKFGFDNYLALISYLIALVLCVLWTDSFTANPKRASLLIYGLLLSAGVTFTWLLAAPIGFLIVLLSFISGFSKPVSNMLAWISKNILVSLASLLILAISCLQGIFQIKYSVIPGNINADGGMWTLNYIILTLMLVGIFVWIASNKQGLNKSASNTMLISVVSFGVIAGFINFYQYYSAGKSSYYASKMGALLFIVLFVFIGGVIINELEKLSVSYGKFLTFTLTLSLVFIVPLATSANMKDLRFANGVERKLSPYSASQITGLIYQKQAYSNNVFVFKELDYEEDIISSHFVNMLSRKSPDCVQHFIWHKIAIQRDEALQDILSCSKENPNTQYYVLDSANNNEQLTKLFKSQSNIKTILSN